MYLVYQLELGAEGTLHFQGYVRYAKRLRLSTAKGFLHPTAHLELARGTEQANKEYCTKEDTRVDGPWEFGVYDATIGPGQGHRTDLSLATDALVAGTSMREICLAHPETFVRYHQGLYSMKDLVSPPAPVERDVHSFYLWGPTAVGKSHRAMHQYPDAYLVETGRDPWGQYQDQETIVMDEWTPPSSGGLIPQNASCWTLQTMNRILDKWRLRLSCRYRDKEAHWTRVIICTNLNPDSVYQEYPDALRESFFRRLVVIEIHSRDQEVIIP